MGLLVGPQVPGDQAAGATDQVLRVQQVDSGGSVVSPQGTGTTTLGYAAVSIGTSAAVIKAARSSRQSILVQNAHASNDLYVGADSSVTTSNGLKLVAGASLTLDSYTGAVYGIASAASDGCRIPGGGLMAVLVPNPSRSVELGYATEVTYATTSLAACVEDVTGLSITCSRCPPGVDRVRGARKLVERHGPGDDRGPDRRGRHPDRFRAAHVHRRRTRSARCSFAGGSPRSAGSHTYKILYVASAGTAKINAGATFPRLSR